MNNVDNNNLIQAVIDLQAGKEGAFDVVYRQSLKAAYSFASVMLKNAEDIEDVLQTSYMYVAQNIKALKSPESFLSWLHVIVRHECQKQISKKTKAADLFLLLANEENKEPALSYDEISSQILEQGAVRDAVKGIIDSLSPEKRICIVLHYYEQLTLPEIAQELGIPEGTVKSRLHSARNEIEKKINKIKKKNDSLFGISAMPIILAFLKSQAETVVVPLAVQESIIAGIAAGEGVATAAAVTAGSAAAEVSATALGTGVGSVTGAAAGSAAAAKVVAVSLAAVVATGGSVVAAKTIMEKTTRQIIDFSSSGIYEETTTHPHETEALLFAMGIDETTAQETESIVSGTAKTTDSAVQTSAVTSATAKPMTTNAKHTTTKPSTTHALTTHALTTTQPVTEKQATTRPATTKPATTAAATTSADDVYAVSGGVLSEYTGSGGSISIPSVIDSSTVTAIGAGAFSGNTKITAVTLPSTVTKIGTLAFDGCTKLARVTLPSSLVSIGSGAFCGCTSLSSVNVPSGVTVIGDDAFDGCSSLTSITVPDSVTDIGVNAFGGCDNLTIKCSEGSAAHDYAVENSIDFELI